MDDLFKKMTSNLNSDKVKAANELEEIGNPKQKTCNYVIAPKEFIKQIFRDQEKSNKAVTKKPFNNNYIIAPASALFEMKKEAEEKAKLLNQKTKTDEQEKI